MELDIEFTKRAEDNLDAIVAYIEYRWNEKTKIDFLAKLSENLYLISKMPYLFPASSIKKDIRRCIVNKNIALYYRIESEKIIVISIQDTRINPDNLLI